MVGCTVKWPSVIDDITHTLLGLGFSCKLGCKGFFSFLCTLLGRRPGIAEGNELTRLGRVHLYFFSRFLTNYRFVGY